MAPKESEDVDLLQSFQRRFLAARALRSFPWQSLEEKLRDSSDSQLLLDILQKPFGDAVTLSESTAIVSHGTTGLVTWNAALYLAEWALENPAAFAGRNILELGSGAGLTGLAICRACHPRTYIFSDCHSRVLEQLRGNILLNGLSLQPDVPAPQQPPKSEDAEKPAVKVTHLDWDLATTTQLAAFQPDVVLAADVLYCPETVHSLVGVLQKLSECRSGPRAVHAYIAFTVRNPETCKLFTAQLGQVGMPWEAMPGHDQKLFPYDELCEMEMLRLTL
ncbi:PREDICTED: protein FAM86A-like isoform X3 [Elephantulus edwardii]|uniref:protein FAM86A-like isoform X3 n=1 Tax=Elephantulus edwardii TaxID=28737 RepID=UPI0003F0B531|nr:PREDICTED: protein FAM86A-like isoform X3 [Elephantulus edwardii]